MREHRPTSRVLGRGPEHTRQDSNLQPTALETAALPIELRAQNPRPETVGGIPSRGVDRLGRSGERFDTGDVLDCVVDETTEGGLQDREGSQCSALWLRRGRTALDNLTVLERDSKPVVGASVQ